MLTRRRFLEFGGASGLTLGGLWRARAAAPVAPTTVVTRNPIRACILVFNYGGPSHLDTFDLKPNAPREVRGEFNPTPTRVPGVSISEHLPRLAALANRYAIVRSVTHRDNDHAIGAYLALTGYSHPKHEILGIEPPATPLDMPSLGSVASKLRPADKPVFPYVTLGDLRHFGNNDSLGQNAGCLGRAYDPFTVPFVRPMNGELDLGLTRVMAAVDAGAIGERRSVREQLDHVAPMLETTADSRSFDGFTRRALELLSSPASRDAFNLAKEPPQVRDFYGPTPFARNCLLARRLVEAGVPLVTACSFGKRGWDTPC